MAQFWTRKTIRGRGWSDALITEVLGEPDVYAQASTRWKNPAGLFSITRVCDEERTPKVRERTQKLLKQRGDWRAWALEGTPEGLPRIGPGEAPPAPATGPGDEELAQVCWTPQGKVRWNVEDESARRRWLEERTAFPIVATRDVGRTETTLEVRVLGTVTAKWHGPRTRKGRWLVLGEARAGEAEGTVYGAPDGADPLRPRPGRAHTDRWTAPSGHDVDAYERAMRPAYDAALERARRQHARRSTAADALLDAYPDADPAATRALARVLGTDEDTVEAALDARAQGRIEAKAKRDAKDALKAAGLRAATGSREGTRYSESEEALIAGAAPRGREYVDALAKLLGRNPTRVATLARKAHRATRGEHEKAARAKQAGRRRRRREEYHAFSVATRHQGANTPEATREMPPDRVSAIMLRARGWTAQAVRALLGPPAARQRGRKGKEHAVWWADDVEAAEASEEFTALGGVRSSTPVERTQWGHGKLDEVGWTKDERKELLAHAKASKNTWQAREVWRIEQTSPMRERLAERQAERKRQAQAYRERRSALDSAANEIPLEAEIEDADMPPDRVTGAELAQRGWSGPAVRALLGPAKAWRRGKKGVRHALWWSDDVEAGEASDEFEALGGRRCGRTLPRRRWDAEKLRRRGWTKVERTRELGHARVDGDAPGLWGGEVRADRPMWLASAVWAAEQGKDMAQRRRAREDREERAPRASRTSTRALAASDTAASEREDLTDIEWTTVDPTRRGIADDAIWIETLAPGALRVWVAVADVGGTVAEGSKADNRARERGEHLVTPRRAEPVFRNADTARARSLDEGEVRRALVTTIDVDAKGCRATRCMVPAQVRVHESTTYARAEREALEGRGPWAQWRGAASAIEMDRRRAGGVLLGPARSAWWDGEAVRTAGLLEPEQWVAALMVAANAANGAWLAGEGAEGLWRRQGGALPEALVRRGRANTPVQAWRWRCAIEHALGPAEYTCDRNAHHASLKLVSYGHTTSPLRRYADVVMQRAAYAVREGRAMRATGEAEAEALNRRRQAVRGTAAEDLRAAAGAEAKIEPGQRHGAVVVARDGATARVALTHTPGVWGEIADKGEGLDPGEEVEVEVRRWNASTGAIEMEVEGRKQSE